MSFRSVLFRSIVVSPTRSLTLSHSIAIKYNLGRLYSQTANMAEEAPKTDPKITLYWLNASRSHRILWLLEELKLKYELKTFKRQSDMLAPKELKDVHPLGKSPVLTIQNGEETPFVIAESGSIVEYVLEHWGQNLMPKKWKDGKEGQPTGETEEWMRYRYYMHYSEGSLAPLLTLALILNQLKSPQVPFIVRPISRAIAGRVEDAFLKRNLLNHWNFLDQQLQTSSGKFLAGDQLTGADILMLYPFQAGEGVHGLTKEDHPKLFEYREMLTSREAYKRAVKRAEEESGMEFDPNLPRQ